MSRDRHHIRIRIHLRQPPAAVWAVLTAPDLRSRWLLPGDLTPAVGRAYELQGPEPPDADLPKRGRHDWRIRGVVRQVVTQERFSYTWLAYGLKQPTLVTWKLLPAIAEMPLSGADAGPGTDLVLEHVGFRGVEGLLHAQMYRIGWAGQLKRMRKLLAVLAREQRSEVPAS
jgi:uncharacterized protein YndB with AHSA1/START domain